MEQLFALFFSLGPTSLVKFFYLGPRGVHGIVKVLVQCLCLFLACLIGWLSSHVSPEIYKKAKKSFRMFTFFLGGGEGIWDLSHKQSRSVWHSLGNIKNIYLGPPWILILRIASIDNWNTIVDGKLKIFCFAQKAELGENYSRIHRSMTGDKVNSGIELSYRPVSPCSLAGRYDNPMPELTLSPSLRILLLDYI